MLSDFRQAFRLISHHPGFACATVISLALGIGATTTIYALVDAVLIRPLNLDGPERLVMVTDANYNVASYPDYLDLRDGNRTLAGFAGYALRELSLATRERAEIVNVGVVSGNYFEVVGVRPAAGRLIEPEDDRGPSQKAVAVLSHARWLQQFGGRPEAIGETIRLNGAPFTIVGVAPKGFRGVRLRYQADLFIPIAMWEHVAAGPFAGRSIMRRSWGWMTMVGRLGPGATIERASADLNAIAATLTATYPESPDPFALAVHPIGVGAAGIRTRGEFSQFVRILVGVVAMAFAIACANVASLFLARALARRREMGIRVALGASRRRLLWQLLSESLVIALLGGAGGVLIALWSLDLLGGFELPGGIEVGKLDVGLDWRALAFTAVVAMLSAVLFGLVPAFQASAPGPGTALRDQPLAMGGRNRLRGAFVAVQIALSMVLLVGAALFGRAVQRVFSTNLGFQHAHVALAGVNLGLARYDAPRAGAFYEQAIARIEALPGVESAAWAAIVPASEDTSRESVRVPGYVPRPNERLSVNANFVWPGYFRTLGIPLTRGRDFGEADRAPAVIVSEAAAARFWPGADPVGRPIRIMNVDATVIAIAGDVPARPNEPAVPTVYMPLPLTIPAAGLWTVRLAVRTAGEPEPMLGPIGAVLRDLDAGAPVFDLETMDARIADRLAAQRSAGFLLGLLSILGLVLSAVGTYGLAAYWAGQRLREFGIRVALGATPREIVRLVLRHGSIAAGIGLVVGLTLAALGSRALSGLLFGVGSLDPIAFSGAAAVLALVALLATYMPASRASRVDPVAVLRIE